MKQNTVIAACIAAFIFNAGMFCAGCGKDPGRDAARDFDRIAVDALGLYRIVHPLRWSRLGLEGADSLLFTFTAEEIVHARGTLDSLVASLSEIHAAHLDARRLDESELLLNWLMGLRFALGPSGEFRRNPLLYCWLIEEALFGIPARAFPAADTEEDAYARRISRLPLLVETASLLLVGPGVPYLEPALRQIDDLESRLSALERQVTRRYGRPIADLPAAAEAVGRFREALSALLEQQPRDRMIMGLEDLALVMKYAEHIVLDPAKMNADAETTLRRLLQRRGVSEHAPAAITGAAATQHADSLLTVIEEAVALRIVPDQRHSYAPVRVQDPLYRPLRIPANPYLVVPATPMRPVYVALHGCGRAEHAAAVVVTPQASDDGDMFFYDLLLASSPFAAPEKDVCRARPPLRFVLRSETFYYGWRALMLQELLPMFPQRKALLARIETEERIQALARMVVALRLHAGTFTMEAATRFLSETAMLSPQLCADEAACAAVSPAAACEGLAVLLLEQMIRQVDSGRSERPPRAVVREVLRDGAMAPLTLLMRRMP